MDKKLLVFFSIIVLVLLGMAVFLYFSPEERFHNTFGFFQMQETYVVRDVDSGPRYAPEINLMAGICVLLLVGYLFWSLYQKFQKDTQAELMAKKNSLYDISLATGRTEYDLFYRSAQDWSVSAARIDQDFKSYMADQVMPHYAKDFVRKNQAHIDDLLVKKEEVKPTSWSDLAIALLVFPGSILFLFILIAF